MAETESAIRASKIYFMKQMPTHHQAAIDTAKVHFANGKDAETRKLS